MSEVPDFAEVCIGWRAWVVLPGPLLESVTTETVWRPGRRMEARCSEDHDHPTLSAAVAFTRPPVASS